ncbi:MAG: type II toxin-antitoxin system ParD family antitoxin [Methylophagaceae bacterium]
MTAGNVNVRVTGELQNHLQQQIGSHGLFDNASEYIRSLIRQDLKSRDEAWSWLRSELESALRASDDEFTTVTAEDVILRNKKKR